MGVQEAQETQEAQEAQTILKERKNLIRKRKKKKKKRRKNPPHLLAEIHDIQTPLTQCRTNWGSRGGFSGRNQEPQSHFSQ